MRRNRNPYDSAHKNFPKRHPKGNFTPLYWRLTSLNLTNQDYGKLVNDRSKPSPMWKNMLWAFFVGGAICTAGQGLSALYQSWGLDQEKAGTAVSITLIFASALLTGLGCFDNLAKRAGAGTLVPITGFANAMVSPALEFKSED